MTCSAIWMNSSHLSNCNPKSGFRLLASRQDGRSFRPSSSSPCSSAACPSPTRDQYLETLPARPRNQPANTCLDRSLSMTSSRESPTAGAARLIALLPLPQSRPPLVSSASNPGAAGARTPADLPPPSTLATFTQRALPPLSCEMPSLSASSEGSLTPSARAQAGSTHPPHSPGRCEKDAVKPRRARRRPPRPTEGADASDVQQAPGGQWTSMPSFASSCASAQHGISQSPDKRVSVRPASAKSASEPSSLPWSGDRTTTVSRTVSVTAPSTASFRKAATRLDLP